MVDSHAVLIEENARLRKAIKSLRREHVECDDPWHSCPKSDEGCANEGEGDDCTCGADAVNAIIDAVVGNATGTPPGLGGLLMADKECCETCRDYHDRTIGGPMNYKQGMCTHHGIDVEPGSYRRCYQCRIEPRDNVKPKQSQGN